MNITKIKQSAAPSNKRQAAFLAIHVEASLYTNYSEVPEEHRSTITPLVLMVQRWDGLIGFPGGLVEPGESIYSAMLRESFEETGYVVKGLPECIGAYETDDLVATLFSLSVSFSDYKDILANQHSAEHFLVENCLTSVHVRDYGPDRPSFSSFIKNQFAIKVKEQLSDLIIHLGWDTKFGTPTAFA